MYKIDFEDGELTALRYPSENNPAPQAIVPQMGEVCTLPNRLRSTGWSWMTALESPDDSFTISVVMMSMDRVTAEVEVADQWLITDTDLY